MLAKLRLKLTGHVILNKRSDPVLAAPVLSDKDRALVLSDKDRVQDRAKNLDSTIYKDV